MADNTINIKVRIDDKGNLSVLGKKAKAAGEGLERTAKGARTADRNLKGAARTSSNTTKNFSKMAQGINGGLVPAYAVLAANIFAVSAAFNFLKEAGNLVALQRGQEAYAASTGVALRTLAQDIVAATEAQVAFTDASQAAAIGTAAGLTTDQLTALGEGAKNVSVILGRDVTDSFNRLVRGVTKAEPELLDELGIILRLDDATQRYAAATGKAANALSVYEKSQAVTLEVLRQLDEKYNQVADSTDLSVNSFNQLGRAFDEIINRIKELSVVFLGPLADAIVKTPELGIAALGLFAKTIITAVLPGIGDFGTRAQEAGDRARVSLEKTQAKLQTLGKTYDRTAGKAAAAGRLMKLQDPGFQGTGFKALRKGRGAQLSSQQLVGMKSAINSTKKLSDEMKAKWVKDLDVMLFATKRSTVGIKQAFETTGTGLRGIFARIKIAWSTTMAAMATIARFTAAAISLAFTAIGWVAIIYSIYEVGRSFFGAKEETEKASDAAQEYKQRIEELTERTKGLNEQFEKFADVQDRLTSGGSNAQFLRFFEAFGKNISQIDFESFEKSYERVFTRGRAANLPFQTDDGSRITFAQRAFSDIGTDFDRTFVNSLIQIDETLNKVVKENFGGDAPDAVRRFQESINDLGKAIGPSGVLAAFNELRRELPAVEAVLNSITAINMRGIQIAEEFGQAIGKITNESREQQLANLLGQQIEALNNNTLGRDFSTEIARLEAQRKIVLDIVETERNQESRRNQIAIERERDARNLTSLQRERFNDLQKITDLDNQILQIGEKLIQIERVRNFNNRDYTETELRQIEALKEQAELLGEQANTVRNNINLMQQFANATNQSFETGLQRGLTAIFKGQESSLKDTVLGIAKSMVESVAEVAAENLTRMITGSFSGVQIASAIAAGGTTAAGAISAAMLAAGTTIAGMLGASSMAAPVVSSIGSLVGIPAGNRLGIGRTPIGASYTNAEKLASMVGIFPDRAFANGGIAEGGFQSYANGGIINQPTVGLVGEGRFNEAVVPLPNGKAIPVDMKGSGGVTVNVAVNNNGSATTSVEGAEQQSANFGKAIAMAVQKEIQNQKRSGGMLSPYGVA